MISRLALGLLFFVGSFVSLSGVDAAETDAGMRLGVASFSFRNFDLDKTLAMTKQVGLDEICLKSCHLPMNATAEQFATVQAKCQKAGVRLYAVGVIYMTNAKEVEEGFLYAKKAGVKLMVIAPTAAMLPLISEKAKEYEMFVAIHNHGPGDRHFPTPESVYEKIKDLDPHVGLCVDIGHTVRVGADLDACLEEYADRVYDIHVKDVTEATPQGHGIQLGRGVIDIPRFFQTLKKIGYRGVVSFEYEEQPENPVPGLAESVGYAKGTLATLEALREEAVDSK